MLRRGRWQSHKRAVEKHLHTRDGFVDLNNAFETARYLVVDFIPDGQFCPDLDEEFGKQLRELIARRVSWPTNSPTPHMANQKLE